MIALDTNILARFLLQDDPAQFKLAKDLLAQNAVYTAPPTVILELVWVLESYDCTRKESLAGPAQLQAPIIRSTVPRHRPLPSRHGLW